MMDCKQLLVLSVIALVSITVAGCGEKPTVTVYKQGKYQGKPDTQPWSAAQFKGDKAAWENAIKTRTDSQNEYVRIGS